MPAATHISRNGDGSLRHRIDGFLAALETYKNIQHSKKFIDDPEWADMLGHAEDIQQAEKILEQSLSHFTNLIDQYELKLALSQGFLTDEQAQEFSKTKVQMEFEGQTRKSKFSGSDKWSQSQ